MIETSRSFGRNVIGGISQYVAEHRNWTLYFRDHGIWDSVPDIDQDWNYDGIISRCCNYEVHQHLKRKMIPCIEILGDEKRFFPNIRNDEKNNCFMGAEHFLSRGAKDFAYFALKRDYWALVRLQNYRDALGERGNFRSALFCTNRSDVSIRDNHTAGRQKNSEQKIYTWLNTLPKPISIFCDWDISAFFLMNVCRLHGILIPEEVSVLGYGNNADLCVCSTPSLSSVAANGREIGYQAACMLEDVFQGKPLPETPVIIPASHVAARSSTNTLFYEKTEVARAVGFIKENIASDITVSQVARHLGTSKATLNRLFRSSVNCRSPEEEIRFRRLEWGKELLRETSFTINKISLMLHFSSATSFIRSFKNLYQLTPKEYRKSFSRE